VASRPRDPAQTLDPDRLARAVAISQEKMQVLAEFWPLAGFAFERPAELEPKARERWLDASGRHALERTRAALAQVEPFAEEGIERVLGEVQESLRAKPREIYQPLRVALTGGTISPGIFESVALLGREETLRRIDAALIAAE
jgi:glutamyl-tRNA synthetase